MSSMNIKFPPLINVTADIKGAKYMLGQVVLEMEVRGKAATITMSPEVVKVLVSTLKGALPKA